MSFMPKISAIKTLFNDGPSEIRRKIIEYRQNIVKVDRPDWDHYLMNMAKAASLRSPDSQTKIGAVVVNSDNQILGTGYNGPVGGIDDRYIPNIRPYKYPFFSLHAEVNAICNCPQKPVGGKVYVIMKPCCGCLQLMAQIGIKEVIYLDNHPVMCKDPDEAINFEILLALLENKIKLRILKE